jgi:hypothetical protein
MAPMNIYYYIKTQPDISSDIQIQYIILALVSMIILAICTVWCAKCLRNDIQNAEIVRRIEPGTKIYTLYGQEIT